MLMLGVLCFADLQARARFVRQMPHPCLGLALPFPHCSQQVLLGQGRLLAVNRAMLDIAEEDLPASDKGKHTSEEERSFPSCHAQSPPAAHNQHGAMMRSRWGRHDWGTPRPPGWHHSSDWPALLHRAMGHSCCGLGPRPWSPQPASFDAASCRDVPFLSAAHPQHIVCSVR